MNCINSSLYCALTAAMWRLWMCWRRLGLTIMLITIIIKHPDITITLIIIISFPELEIRRFSSTSILRLASTVPHSPTCPWPTATFSNQLISRFLVQTLYPKIFKRWNKIYTFPTSSGFGPSGALDLSQPVQNLSEPDIIVGHPLQQQRP